MGNCLVTKLKEQVQNDNLLSMGSMFLNVTQATIPSGQETKMQSINMEVNAPVKLIVHGNGHIATSLAGLNPGSTQLELSAGEYNIFFENANYKVEVTNKYSVDVFRTQYDVSIITCNIDDFKYNSTLRNLRLYGNFTGNIENLPSTVKTLLCYDTSIKGNLNVLNGRSLNSGGSMIAMNFNPNITGNIFTVNPNVSEYELQESPNLGGDVSDLIGTGVTRILGTSSGITGSMKDLGKVVSLTQCHIGGCHLTSGGRIEDFVASRRGIGQTTGSCVIVAYGMGILFNGSTDNVNINTRNLSWTASTITYGDLTIDNSEIFND